MSPRNLAGAWARGDGSSGGNRWEAPQVLVRPALPHIWEMNQGRGSLARRGRSQPPLLRHQQDLKGRKRIRLRMFRGPRRVKAAVRAAVTPVRAPRPSPTTKVRGSLPLAPGVICQRSVKSVVRAAVIPKRTPRPSPITKVRGSLPLAPGVICVEPPTKASDTTPHRWRTPVVAATAAT
jgi:hypothetical protein